MTRIVIVGAGPAGIAAADALSAAPVEVTLIDEAARPGGQLYRSPAPGLKLDMSRLLGSSHGAYAAFHDKAAGLCRRLDYRPGTLVWSIHGGAVHLASASGAAALPYDALILATGATDRIMPAPGWTLPGVFTLGGAQALLKDQGVAIGRRVVFCGSSPLLYLAASQYLRMGVKVAAVIDSTPFAAKLRALPDMARAPATLAAGLRAMAELRLGGVPIHQGARIERFEGEERLAAVQCRAGAGQLVRIACDAAAYGHGLRPEAQLAELAGCELRYDPVQRLHLPVIDGDGRAGERLYIAGDGGHIGGGQAASLSGALAAAALLDDLGLPASDVDRAGSRRSLARLRGFPNGIAAAFRWPREQVVALADDTILCRCENIRVGEVRAALRQPMASPDANRIKAVSRCGMGRCQGRFCGPALAELVGAGHAGELDRLRAQAPIKPLPIALAGEAAP
ncbi:NAD(P)/FAD-dependent oxidoreductase [Bosea sp. BK604]|uniref:FAD/NAD(P)-dependent oxidoreductase n=1 Tax=Bosea sp. BK604 TaxID=2512180 RepID=UPI0010485881|nr:NAD(P)/FAD-dependent oxidoreductase [Bosea sp. BK604]TCR63153.1 hypothetical protein EV560_109247 [Bosea sp. BK604]